MTTITSPQDGYTGESTFADGTVLKFRDGTARHDGDLPQAVADYLKGAGFGINSDADERQAPKVADPRDYGQQIVGTPLRDAAVNPESEDFLAPLNAGKEGEEGNPHGPNVVSPEIHASGDQAIVPGPIGRYVETEYTTPTPDGRELEGKRGEVVTDLELQEAREKEYAERVLIGDELVPEVTADLGGLRPEQVPAQELKGQALDDALADAGLSKSGSADEKRARLAAHQAEQQREATDSSEVPGGQSTADIAEAEGLEGEPDDDQDDTEKA